MDALADIARRVGRRRGDAPGPTLIVTGGVHGNEPAGVRAARAVLARLDEAGAPRRGELVALAGNLRALRRNRRFLERDLNRQWTPEGLARAARDGAEGDELLELRAALDEAVAAARGPVFFVDLHTTSAAGAPFALAGEGAAERRFAAAVPAPAIVGLDAHVRGVVTGYLASLGAVALSVEGGQHESPAAQRCLEAAILCALAAAGLADRGALPGLEAAERLLAEASAGLPRMTEITDRHPVTPDDGFRMEPGYANLDRVRAGDLLATDRRGEIRAPRDAILLLPLYQPQGEDGFFLGREVDASSPS